MKEPTVLGVDIGGSHITAAVVDLEKGLLFENSIKRHAVNSKKNKNEILSSWCEIIDAALCSVNSKVIKIGIAMPGPFDYENGISLIRDQDKFTSLYQVNIKVELAKRLQIEPTSIKFINDAAAFMQGEVFAGVARGYTRVLGLTLGTGLGSAIAINGSSEDAALWNSKLKNGIAEDYLSTRWFTDEYQRLTGKKIEGVKELALIKQKEPIAKTIFNEFGVNLSEFLDPLIKEHHTEVVILGGNISQAYSSFSKSLLSDLEKRGLKIAIKTTELNEHASLIGAASCWITKKSNMANVVDR